MARPSVNSTAVPTTVIISVVFSESRNMPFDNAIL
jgi:hypothetical protein